MTKRVSLVLFVAAVCSVPSYAQQATTPTYSKDVAPILFAHCSSCHRAGEMAPMSLMNYQEVRPWARAVAARVADGTMPPWHADPAHGTFSNARILSETQKATITWWVSAGAPEGDPRDLPAPPSFDDGWNIGEPDAVLSMQEDYPIPATGELPYRFFAVPANFAEDRFIQAWEIKPGNRSVVHHIIVSTRSPKEGPEQQVTPTRSAPLFSYECCTEIPAGKTGGRPLPPHQRTVAGQNDRPRPTGSGATYGGYVPGNGIRMFPEGLAIRLPKGSSLVFEIHYTTYGTATTDRTKMGVKFAKAAPKAVLNFAPLINASFSIPPRAADHLVENTITWGREIMLYSLVPHTHVRGKRWLYEAIYPDGRNEVILSVPNYDFNWQHEYVFATPLRLPAGTKIRARAWYDNSPGNTSNPDPSQEVKWGDQTWEEMMSTFISFYEAPTASGRVW